MANGYGVDEILRGIEITSSNNQLVYDDPANSGTTTATITTGTYYPYAGVNTVDGKSELYDQIVSDVGPIEEIQAGDAPDTDLSWESTRIYSNSDLTLLISDSSWTLPPGVLGLFGQYQSPSSDVWMISDDTGSSYSYVAKGEYSCWGKWQPPEVASDKSLMEHKTIHQSHDDPKSAYQYLYRTRKMRRVEYEYIPAAHVRQKRATHSKFASVADLKTGDANNQLYDLWKWATQKGDLIFIHNEGDESTLNVDTKNYEIVQLGKVDQRRNFSKLYDNIRANTTGEIYNISFDLWVDDSVRVADEHGTV